MPQIAVNDDQIYYKTSGPAPAASAYPVLLLIHGAGGSHLDWPSTVRYIDKVPVIALDLPGHGNSCRPGRQTIDEYANVTIDFVEKLGLTRVIVVGHSMGGAIAQMVALQKPTWLESLVLIGTGPIMRVAPQILDNVYGDMPAVADFVTKYAWFKNANFIMKGVGRRRILETDPDVLHGDYSACNTFDIRTQLSEIQVAALVIGGDSDRFMPLKFSHMLLEGLPLAKLVVVSGAGHMIQLEKPDEVRSQLNQFAKINRLENL